MNIGETEKGKVMSEIETWEKKLRLQRFEREFQVQEDKLEGDKNYDFQKQFDIFQDQQ